LLLSPTDERIVFLFNGIATTLATVPIILFARSVLPWRHGGLATGLLYAIWPVGVRLAPSEDCSNPAMALAWVGLWLISSVADRPKSGRLWAAMIAISLAVQTRDSLQPLALLAIALAVWHVGRKIAPRQWSRLALGTVLFNGLFVWLFFTVIAPKIWQVDGFSIASQLRYWAFWGWTPANPIFDPSLTPLIATILALVAVVWAISRRREAEVVMARPVLWSLLAFIVLSNGLALLKSMSLTDAFMFHPVYMPALFVLAEVGLLRLWRWSKAADKRRMAVAGALTGLLLVPSGWQTISARFLDQHEWQVYQRTLDSVPARCTLVQPMREDFGDFFHGIADQPWAQRSEKIRIRSLSWLLSGGVYRGEGASNRSPVKEIVGECLYYFESLTCAMNAPRELTRLDALRKRLAREADAFPPRGMRTLIEQFHSREYRRSADFKQPICRRVHDAFELVPLQVETVSGVGRGNSFIVAANPLIGLFRIDRSRPTQATD
jgi:hypothetical protein